MGKIEERKKVAEKLGLKDEDLLKVAGIGVKRFASFIAQNLLEKGYTLTGEDMRAIEEYASSIYNRLSERTLLKNVEAFGETVPVLPVNPEMYMVWKNMDRPKYKEIFGLHPIYTIFFNAGKNLLLVGDPGIGKTLSVVTWCYDNKVPLVSMSVGARTDVEQLLGSWTIINQSTYFQLGLLPTAVEVANKVGKCVLFIDEIAAMQPEQQKILNSLLDFRRSIAIPEIGKIFRLKSGVKFMVVAATNPWSEEGSGSFATNTLNTDLLSRFATIYLRVSDPGQVREFFGKKKSKGDMYVKSVIPAMPILMEQKNLDYTISFRDLDRFRDLTDVFLEQVREYKRTKNPALRDFGTESKAVAWAFILSFLAPFPNEHQRASVFQIVKDRASPRFWWDRSIFRDIKRLARKYGYGEML